MNRDKAKEKEQADKNQTDKTTSSAKITVPKQQVVDYSAGKLISNTMMNINLQAGYICRWKPTIRKR